MKGWILLGVLLAVVGVVVFLNGLNNRLGSPDKAQLPKRESPSILATVPDTTRPTISSMSVTAVVESDSLMQSPTLVSESTIGQKKVPGTIAELKPNSTGSKPVLDELGTELATIDFDPFVGDDPGDRKKSLLKVLRDNGWKRDELEQLAGYLSDPRTVFRSEILVRNSTFTESAEQYGHNLTPESISRSIKFIDDYREPLESARRLEGVPVEILVAILKVETNLGEWRGKESVFNVFWSLSLGDHPTVQSELLTSDPTKVVEMKGRMNRRAKWARGQLRDLLLVARHGGENPVGILGSFAGAFGLPQFIPSSYRSFGQDGNGDGIIDLDGVPDAVRSIGFYLKENGWPNRPDRRRMHKSILNYNHSTFYADCVLSLADSLSMRTSGSLIAN